MASFDYFGFKYSTLQEKNECELWGAPNVKGRVVVPKYVECNGEKYTVTKIHSWVGDHVIEPQDKRLKDKDKWPTESCHCNSPFAYEHNYYEPDFNLAFPPNRTVKVVVLPDTINMLGGGCFRRCYALEEVNLPKGITVIPFRAFSGCRALKSIQLHEGITEIDDKAFFGCSAMKEITIPSTVIKIGEQAFGDSAETKSGLEVVNILNDEGEVLMYPDSFTDRVKIKYLGKPKSAKKTAKAETPKAAPKPAKTETKVEPAKAAPKPAKAEAPKPAAKPAATKAAAAQPAGNYKKSATCGEYFIGIQSDNKVVITKGGETCSNAKAALRDVAVSKKISVDDKWTTQQLGAKLVDFINGK